MTSGEPITLWPFIEPTEDGAGYIVGLKDDGDRILGSVVPLTAAMISHAVKLDILELNLEPRCIRDDGTMGIESADPLRGELFEVLFDKGTVLGKRPIDELVIEAMDVVDNDPEAMEDLRTFKDRLRRSLDAVEAKIAERAGG